MSTDLPKQKDWMKSHSFGINGKNATVNEGIVAIALKKSVLQYTCHISKVEDHTIAALILLETQNKWNGPFIVIQKVKRMTTAEKADGSYKCYAVYVSSKRSKVSLSSTKGTAIVSRKLFWSTTIEKNDLYKQKIHGRCALCQKGTWNIGPLENFLKDATILGGRVVLAIKDEGKNVITASKWKHLLFTTKLLPDHIWLGFYSR